jgi:hypothetical protein
VDRAAESWDLRSGRRIGQVADESAKDRELLVHLAGRPENVDQIVTWALQCDGPEPCCRPGAGTRLRGELPEAGSASSAPEAEQRLSTRGVSRALDVVAGAGPTACHGLRQEAL